MSMKLKIKKGATVQVIAGAEKGKKGTVMEVVPGKMGVRVQGIRVQTHFDKKDGLIKKEGLIHYSNLKMTEVPASQNKTASKTKSKSGSARKASL